MTAELVVDRNGLEILDVQECWRLLASVKMGRVGVTTDAMPVVLPVEFACESERIVFSSRPGTKLYTALQNVVVAFEADDVDRDLRHGWSVCVTGRATVIRDRDQLARLDRLGLRTWSDSASASYVVIDPQFVTGRRFRSPGRSGGPPGPV